MPIKTRLHKISEVRNTAGIISSPAIIDNQYVNYATFSGLTGKSLKSIRDQIAVNKSIDTLSTDYYNDLSFEYKKSLLFSNEVLINRAYFPNSLPLIMPILSNDDTEAEAFAEMMDREMICAIMFREKERDFAEMLAHDLLKFELVSEDRIKNFYDSINSGIKCYQLAYDEASKRDVASITSRFRSSLLKLNTMPIPEKKEEVHFLANTIQPMIKDKINVGKFSYIINQLLDSFNAKEDDRNDVYKKHICKAGTEVPNGEYNVSPEVYALKLWVDSIYNENIPTLYQFKTIIPKSFPTAYELKVLYATATANAEISNDSLDDRLARMQANKMFANAARHDLAYEIPFDQLKLSDIVELKKSESWLTFIGALKRYIDGNIAISDFLQTYQAFSISVKGHVERKRIKAKLERAIPVAIDRITVTLEGIVSLICIIYSYHLGVEGVFIVNQSVAPILREIVDIREVLALLSKAGESNTGVSIKKGIGMLAVGAAQRIANVVLNAKQRIEVLDERLSGEKLARYIRALENVEIKGKISGESDKME